MLFYEFLLKIITLLPYLLLYFKMESSQEYIEFLKYTHDLNRLNMLENVGYVESEKRQHKKPKINLTKETFDECNLLQ